MRGECGESEGGGEGCWHVRRDWREWYVREGR